MREAERERAACLAVCGQGTHILVSLNIKWKSSRILIFRVKDRALVQLATLDERDENLRNKRHLRFWRRVGGHLLWFGFSSTDEYLILYHFDPESGELRELVEKRTKSRAYMCLEAYRTGERFYYIGRQAQLMKLALSI